jgi:hypothetical protein
LFGLSRFDLNIEPVFAVMALYDAKEKKKISESFHLDCNPSDIQHKWRDSKDERSLASLSRSAIFNITYPTSDIYLIIKVRELLSTQPFSLIPKSKHEAAREWGMGMNPAPAASLVLSLLTFIHMPEQALGHFL